MFAEDNRRPTILVGSIDVAHGAQLAIDGNGAPFTSRWRVHRLPAARKWAVLSRSKPPRQVVIPAAEVPATEGSSGRAFVKSSCPTDATLGKAQPAAVSLTPQFVRDPTDHHEQLEADSTPAKCSNDETFDRCSQRFRRARVRGSFARRGIDRHSRGCSPTPDTHASIVTAAAYCRARMRIKPSALELMLSRSVKCLHDTTFDTEGRWFGHRVFFADGSSVSMPDTPTLQSHFGQPGGQRAGCGFPTAHALAMMHAGTGMITRMFRDICI